MSKQPLLSPEWNLQGKPPRHTRMSELDVSPIRLGKNTWKKKLVFVEDDDEDDAIVVLSPPPPPQYEDDDEEKEIIVTKSSSPHPPPIDPNNKWMPEDRGQFAGEEEFRNLARRQRIPIRASDDARDRTILNVLNQGIAYVFADGYGTAANNGLLVIALRLDPPTRKKKSVLTGEWKSSHHFNGDFCFTYGSYIMALDTRNKNTPAGILSARNYFVQPTNNIFFDMELYNDSFYGYTWNIRPLQVQPNFTDDPRIRSIVVVIMETTVYYEDVAMSTSPKSRIVYKRP